MGFVVGAAICLVSYVIGYLKHKLQTALVALASGISLILLLSTLVSLTSGTMPAFMLAEPVILLATVIAVIVCIIRSRKKL